MSKSEKKAIESVEVLPKNADHLGSGRLFSNYRQKDVREGAASGDLFCRKVCLEPVYLEVLDRLLEYCRVQVSSGLRSG